VNDGLKVVSELVIVRVGGILPIALLAVSNTKIEPDDNWKQSFDQMLNLLN